MSEPVLHEPVLVEEVLKTLDPKPGQIIVDATLGNGGHLLAILRRMRCEGLTIGIDRDPHMLATARRRFESEAIPERCYRLIAGNFSELPTLLAPVLAEVDAAAPDGVVADLGPSNPQLLDPERGASWTSDEPLDMRMNRDEDVPTAADLVNELDERELARLFRELADERWAIRIARRIVETREERPIQTGRQLGELVAGAIPRKAWPPRIHPATRVFLALRIEVNREFEAIERMLPAAFELLKAGGRLVVIAFQSGELRRVREFMRQATTAALPPWPLPQSGTAAPARWLVRKPQRPTPREVERNPRSRSARLMAIEKVEDPRRTDDAGGAG